MKKKVKKNGEESGEEGRIKIKKAAEGEENKEERGDRSRERRGDRKMYSERERREKKNIIDVRD